MIIDFHKFEFCITLANMLMNKEPIGSNEKYACFFSLFANFEKSKLFYKSYNKESKVNQIDNYFKGL